MIRNYEIIHSSIQHYYMKVHLHNDSEGFLPNEVCNSDMKGTSTTRSNPGIKSLEDPASQTTHITVMQNYGFPQKTHLLAIDFPRWLLTDLGLLRSVGLLKL